MRQLLASAHAWLSGLVVFVREITGSGQDRSYSLRKFPRCECRGNNKGIVRDQRPRDGQRVCRQPSFRCIRNPCRDAAFLGAYDCPEPGSMPAWSKQNLGWSAWDFRSH